MHCWSAAVLKLLTSLPFPSIVSTSLVELLPPLPNLPYSSTSTLSPAPGNRVLIIVPSIELALQAARTVSLSHPDLSVEIEQGSKYVASGVADVTVATYQTLHRSEDRLNKFDPRGFKAVIVSQRLRLVSYSKLLTQVSLLLFLFLGGRSSSCSSSILHLSPISF